jgi:hypothetical protein
MEDILTEQERIANAQHILQQALITLERDFGMTLEPTLQVDVVSHNYATSRAIIALKPIPGWQPSPEALATGNG